jgi:crotonobetainyl-CoA:carnitine CoA-transferase CaiB-like acyl-CoA transferase
MRDVVVVDLSSLWAGPLCGALLAEAGARVLKVESATRPDGARLGSPAFFERLNASKQSVVLDLPGPDGVADLRRLISTADVVIEASRPRALQQMGIDALELLAGDEGPRVWASITGHGRTGERGTWVGFGDDAAVAGGLVVWDDEGPCFCADAVADPITGIVAAAAIAEALTADARVLLDLPLSTTAARFAGGAG